MGIIADLISMGYKNNNYIEDATDNAAGNAKFDSTTEQKYTVPAGLRWILIGGQVTRDANETLTVTIKDASDQLINKLTLQSAATNTVPLLTGSSSTHCHHSGYPLILDAGEYVHIEFGGAQGAGASAACQVIEVPV